MTVESYYRAMERAKTWRRIHALCAAFERQWDPDATCPIGPVVLDGLFMSMDGRELQCSDYRRVPVRIPFDVTTRRPFRVVRVRCGTGEYGIPVFETIGYRAESVRTSTGG